MPEIQIKRIYEPAEESDGYRVLVDRLWPRGMTKAKARIDLWLKEIAPSTALRKWFGHVPSKWDEFQKRYRIELNDHPGVWEPIREAVGKGDVTLLYSAHDMQHNSAVVLKAFLEERIKN